MQNNRVCTKLAAKVLILLHINEVFSFFYSFIVDYNYFCNSKPATGKVQK